MEETIKMSSVNEEGKTIIKDVPKSLYQLYLKSGWQEYKQVMSKKEAFYSKPIKNERNRSKSKR